MPKRFLQKILLLFLLFPLASCAIKAQLTGIWADESRGEYSLDNVLVIGFSRDANVQRLWENIFVDRLGQANVKAIASYATVGRAVKLDRESIIEAIRKTGAQSVIISRVVDASMETQTTLGRRPSDLGIFGFYDLSLSSSFIPPTTVTRRQVLVETNLYEIATEKLIWSSHAEVKNPRMTKADFDAVIGVLIAGLSQKNLL